MITAITDIDFVQFHLFAVFQKVSVRSSADIFISTRGHKKDFVRNEKNRFVPISLQTSRCEAEEGASLRVVQ